MDILSVLKKYWGYDTFREGQEEAINYLLHNRDVLAVYPTGSGKSIIYQVAGLNKKGITLVVSPLIALIEDQVNKLNKLGIKSIALTGSLNFNELERLLDNLEYSEAKFIFLSPERLQNSYVKNRLEKMNITLLAVDEAHCISEWGHDFRPSYLKITALNFLQSIPVLALTATANKRVRNDIVTYLKMKDYVVLEQSMKRENLAYKVVKTNDKFGELLANISNKETYIIYVRTRKNTYNLSYLLNQNGFKTGFFHGGMNFQAKQKALNDWLEDKTKIIVATNAFGMGIDKSNVRKVIHYDMPFSLENYVQEAGRAGRDGKKAEAILLYSQSDIDYFRLFFIDKFPKVDDVVNVYKSLYNYFYIAEGEGDGFESEFNYEKFCKRFNLNLLKTFNIIKILESEDIILLLDSKRYFPEIQIIIQPRFVREYIQKKLKYYDILLHIIRNYSDVFHQIIKIYPSKINDKLNLNKNQLEKALDYFAEKQIISYRPQGKDLRIKFLIEKDRFFLQRKLKKFQKRLEIKKNQLQSMLQYILNDKICRVKQLSDYFETKTTNNCNICDVCINSNNILSDNQVLLKIKELLSEKCLSKKEILKNFSTDIEKYLDFLVEQNTLNFDVFKGYCLNKKK